MKNKKVRTILDKNANGVVRISGFKRGYIKETKNGTIVTAEYFGAIADGVTDCTDAINKAANYVATKNK
ncbi:hypothetical protein ACVXSW_001563 [Vibrio parahaemolyticus]